MLGGDREEQEWKQALGSNASFYLLPALFKGLCAHGFTSLPLPASVINLGNAIINNYGSCQFLQLWG